MISPARRQRLILTALVLLAMFFTVRPAFIWAWDTLLPVSEPPMLPYGILRVGIDASYPPFGVDPGTGEPVGIDADLARAVAAHMDVKLQFVNMGYDGLYDSLKADQVDALFSALRFDPLRTGDARYTTSYFDAGQILVRPPNTGLDTLADMDGMVLAVEFGTDGELEAKRWERRLHSLTIQPYESAAIALTAVITGEADAALVDATSARLWLREQAGNDAPALLEIAPEYTTHDPYMVAVPAANSQLWEAINEALIALQEDGTLDEILNRWL